MISPKKAARKALRVLIVDDNLDHVHSLAYLLKDAGHRVDFAINGIVALDLVQRTKPEVVLLDIGLPDASGLSVASQIRRIPEMRHSYIIAITGRSTTRQEALAAGFDHLLTKPLDFNALDALLYGR